MWRRRRQYPESDCAERHDLAPLSPDVVLLFRRALYGLKRCSPHLVLEVGRLLARPRGSVSMQRDLLGGGGDAVVLRVSCGPPV